MSIASTEAKRRWNKIHYAEVKASLDKELVAQFKAKCKMDGVSIASVLAKKMSEYCGCAQKKRQGKNTTSYSSRALRRKAVVDIAKQVENILQNETAYHENIPENMKNGERAESSARSIENLGCALELLLEAYC